MARILVAGYIVRYPLGGNVWAHLQYVLGLARLGNEVWFLEEAGWPDSCYDPDRDVMTSDPTAGLLLLDSVMRTSGLEARWAYRDSEGTWHGPPADVVDDLFSQADLFLDVGGTCYFAEMHRSRRRGYVDMDPAFTQFQAFGHTRLTEYDVLFTYGTNIGRDFCPIPTLGLRWHPLRPPVVLDIWNDSSTASCTPDDGCWTTIGSWTAYGACEYGGEMYGQKDVEFMRFIDLPRHSDRCFQVALAGDETPRPLLEANGWHLIDPLAVSRDPFAYRDFIQGSYGEFSVAKNAYVKTGSGWVSDRTATYLASGRPCVVQDTDADLPIGCGLLTFRTPEEAETALNAIEADYEAHRRTAYEIARACFDANRVLTSLLNDCGV